MAIIPNEIKRLWLRILEAELLHSLISVRILAHFVDELIELDALGVLIVEVARNTAPSTGLITIYSLLMSG